MIGIYFVAGVARAFVTRQELPDNGRVSEAALGNTKFSHGFKLLAKLQDLKETLT